MEHLNKNLVVFLAALLLFILTVTAFFPGEMSPDSYEQLKQALNGAYTDFHAPIMAAFWRLLLHLWSNPGVLFFFHNLCFWSFWYFLSVSVFENWKAKLAVLALGTLPSVWSQLIVVWKDTELSICFLGAFLFLYLLQKNNLKKSAPFLYSLFFSLALFLFFYSTAVRLNSLPALFPLAFYMVTPKDGKVFSPKVLFMAAGLLSVSFCAVHLFNYDFLKAKKYNLFQGAEAFDIVGILVQTGNTTIIPDYWEKLNARATPQALMDHYNPENLSTLGFNPSPSDLIQMTNDPSLLQDLRDKWLCAIRAFPMAYLRHRWAAFNGLIRIGKKESYYPFHLLKDPEVEGVKETGDRDLRVALKYYFWFFGNSLFFKGWFYLLVSGMVLLFNFIRQGPWTSEKSASIYSAFSALFYGFGYFFYVWTADFRYLYPTVMLCFFSAILLLSDWLRNNPVKS